MTNQRPSLHASCSGTCDRPHRPSRPLPAWPCRPCGWRPAHRRAWPTVARGRAPAMPSASGPTATPAAGCCDWPPHDRDHHQPPQAWRPPSPPTPQAPLVVVVLPMAAATGAKQAQQLHRPVEGLGCQASSSSSSSSSFSSSRRLFRPLPVLLLRVSSRLLPPRPATYTTATSLSLSDAPVVASACIRLVHASPAPRQPPASAAGTAGVMGLTSGLCPTRCRTLPPSPCPPRPPPLPPRSTGLPLHQHHQHHHHHAQHDEQVGGVLGPCAHPHHLPGGGSSSVGFLGLAAAQPVLLEQRAHTQAPAPTPIVDQDETRRRTKKTRRRRRHAQQIGERRIHPVLEGVGRQQVQDGVWLGLLLLLLPA